MAKGLTATAMATVDAARGRVWQALVDSDTHYSPLTGKPDVPDSYHTVTVTLTGEGAQTRVTIAQDNNADDEARRHSEDNWNTMLGGLRKYVERGAS